VCTVDSGDPVTLTATPRSGYKFTGWSGACSGATNPCTLVDVTADTAATANFSALPPAGTTSTGGSSTTTASPSGTFKTGISVLCGGKPCVLVAGAKVTLPAKLVKLARGKAAKKKTITVGTYSHKLGAGKHKALVIRLNSKGRALLKRLHKLPVRVDVRLSAPNERTVRTHRTLKVKAPSKHH
jgi:uncharacterized repeat protein (TIGR02543 family)